jgi:hypothetical protein
MVEKNSSIECPPDIAPGIRSANKVSPLTVAEKIISLRSLDNKTRMDRIVADPDAKSIFRAFEPLELYWMVKIIGENDVSELLELCAPEQIEFFLDMECWQKGEFSEENFIKWLGYLLDTGEKRIIELVPHLELEFLVLSLMKEVVVGGGIGDMTAESEREHNWDHTFDGCYMISFKNSNNAPIIGRFIDIIYRNYNHLYLTLMEGIRTETIGEIEELSYQFRSARLADWGFPELEDALSIYISLDPDSYTPSNDKVASSADWARHDPLPLPINEASFLKKALLSVKTEGPLTELHYLINNAIVAEGISFSEREEMQAVLQRLYGYLNIALEYLCGNDEVKAGVVIETEHLKTLFQLGRGIIAPLRISAGELQKSGDDLTYATNKALLGLKALHPKFYRGLDPDTIDGYREFNCMDDIQLITIFLDNLRKRLI